MTVDLIDAMRTGDPTMAHPIDNLPPIHPGEFLRDELEALGLSARKFAEHIHVPHNAVTGIMNGERSVTAQMAIRLGQAFGTTPRYWLNLQAIYDLKTAQAEMPAEALAIGTIIIAGGAVWAPQRIP
jgi:antitoxin HigA-1